MRTGRAPFSPAILASAPLRVRSRFEPRCVLGIVCWSGSCEPLPMAKKRKHDRVAEEREGERKATPAPAKVFSSPFKDLKKMLADRERVLPKSQPIPKPKPPPAPIIEKAAPAVAEPIDDDSFFRQALEGVRPLHRNGTVRSRIPLDP